MKKLIQTIKDKMVGKSPLLKKRSGQWDEVRDAFLLSHSTCAACGSTQKLEVHHIIPFHVDPSKELNTDNLITLCEGPYKCHLKIGHLGNFRKANPSVLEDASKQLASIYKQ